jgi:hypothetical protein
LKSVLNDLRPYTQQHEKLSISGPALQSLLRSTLEQGAIFRFRAGGSSMSPFIRDGDVICIQDFGDLSPRVGQVVAYTRAGTGGLVVHRVVGKARDGWLVQGDHQSRKGAELVKRGQLHGRVTSMERGGRNLRLGLGPERIFIAGFSRSGLLLPLIRLGSLLRRRHDR